MAQTGYTPIKLYASTTPSAAPLAANLDNTNGAELAINITDGKLFYKDNGGSVQTIAYKNVPISTLSGAGTGVLTALGVNVGTAGAFVVNGGALGTPSSGTLTNATGLPLSTGVTGTLPVANGGTGSTSLTANNVLLGNGTSALQVVAPGTSGNVLTSNGTTWTSATPASTTTLTFNNQTANYTVIASDAGKIINCTANTFTVSLTAAASLGSGFNCWVWNTGTGVITIDPNAAETIDGVVTLTLRQGEGCQIVSDGTNWQTGDKKTMRAYADNIQSNVIRPVASGTNSVSIGRESTSAGTASTALGYTANAQGSLTTAIGYGATTGPTADYSVAIGTNSSGQGSTTSTGKGAMALGGSYASGDDSFAAAIGNNTSSYGAQALGATAIGNLNKVTSAGGYATSVGGYANTVSANWATALGGRSCAAAFDYSIALGYTGTPNAVGKMTFGHASGTAAGIGWGTLSLYIQTTNATPTVLTSSSSSTPGSTNQLVLPNSSAYAFTVLIVGRQQAAGGTASAAWKIEGLIRREASAAATVLVNSATTVLDNTPGWAATVSADTTNGCLAVTVTGAAATNIRWVATVQTSEVTYA